LFIARHWEYPLPVQYDTLILDSLRYAEVFLDTTLPEDSYSQIIFSPTSSFGNRTYNQLDVEYNDLPREELGYAAGLGNVYCSTGWSDNGASWSSVNTLIYYSKSREEWGRPYYIADQDSLISYTPIPEECAQWITDYPEMIKTGNRIACNGHTYVEMLYSYENYSDSSFVIDSLIGYFRNDTLNRKVYFYDSLDTIPVQTYDFSIAADGYTTQLKRVLVGGQLRTYWYRPCELGTPIPGGYIEGLGGATGLYQVRSFLLFYANDEFIVCSNLVCFSVCGQVLYSDSTHSDCNFPAAIQTIQANNQFIKLYPTISSGQFNVEINDLSVHGLEFSIMDLAGQEVKRFTLDKSLTSFDISNCAGGMYIWQALSNNKLLQTGKLVKE
jgi:hypothetical protein